MASHLKITSKRVQDFYRQNPTISFEAVNLIFVDLFEKLLTDMNGTMQSTIQSHVISTLSETSHHLQELKQTVHHLTDKLSTVQSESMSVLVGRVSDMKREYMEEVKQIVHNNTTDVIASLLEQNNCSLIEKTSTIVSDIVPKHQTHHFSQITDLLRAFQATISQDTSTLVKSTDAHSIKEFLNQFEMKMSMLMQNMQQPVYSFLSASEERIQTNLGTIKDSGCVQTKIIQELNDLLGKAGKTNHVLTQPAMNKQLTNVLSKLYTSAEISLQGNSSSTILLKRTHKSNILIENKDCEENIHLGDIQQFLDLVDEQHCNGIIVSQQSGISTKKNFQIEQYNNAIVVYVHNADYSPAMIDAAVDIIDNFSNRLRQYKPMTGSGGLAECSIPKDILDSINNEYQTFMGQKTAIIELFKENQKKMLSQIDEFRFPALDKFLCTKYSMPIQKPGLKCDLCKSFCGNNLKALAAHKRGCIRKNVALANSVMPAAPAISSPFVPSSVASASTNVITSVSVR